jgi:DNA repair exonuclease SbcCD ATPase subunit
MTDREMLSVRVPTELTELVRTDRRTNQEVVEAALWREFGGRRQGAAERRLEEIERRKSIVRDERDSRDEELSKLQEEASRVKSLMAELESEEERENERKTRIVQRLRQIPPGQRGKDNPAIQNRAEDLGIPISDLLDELEAGDE